MTTHLVFLTLDDGAATWLRAFRKQPRRTYDLLKDRERQCYVAIVWGYQPGNVMVQRARREFPFRRGAMEAARAWLNADGRDPGIVRAHPVRARAAPELLQ